MVVCFGNKNKPNSLTQNNHLCSYFKNTSGLWALKQCFPFRDFRLDLGVFRNFWIIFHQVGQI